MTKSSLLTAIAGLSIAGVAFAQRPPENVNAHRHPNLAAAQRLVEQAFTRVTDAQKANEFDLGGHAEKAKALLDEANRELKAAAQTANRK